MDIKNLFAVLEQQVIDLNELLETSLIKQNAIISYDQNLLEEAILKEEKAVQKVQVSEKNRLKIISDFYQNSSIKNSTFKLKEFAETFKQLIPKKHYEFIYKYESVIKELAIQITVVNRQNLYLIENSRAFLKETIKAIANSNKAILDRRV